MGCELIMHLVLMFALAAVAYSAPVATSVDKLVPEMAFPIDEAPQLTEALVQKDAKKAPAQKKDADGSKKDADKKKAAKAVANVMTLMSGHSGGCDLPGPDVIAKDERITVACDGVKYDLSVPSACGTGDAACGLIMDVHGSGMNGLMEEEASGIARYGNKAGYIVIQPSSDDADWSNDSDSHGEWNEIENMEAFLRKMVQDYSVIIDAKKIHVAGFSQGAFVAWNLLCRASDLICSIAPTGFNNHGNYDRSILAKIGFKFSTHSNCWVEGNGPKIARSIFYAQGKHDIFSSPVSFQKSVDKVKKSYGLGGTDGSKLANGCPALLPYRYPHNNRCFENIWRGDSCNVDPRNDPIDFQQKDRQCQFSDSNSLPAGNGYTGVEWQKHSNNGVNVETALFAYKATDDKGKLTVWPFPPSPTGVKAIEGHCFPSSRKDGAPNSAMASCGGKESYIWGQEAVRFFKANACA